MRRVLHLLLIFFVTGCSTFNFGRATPTPAGEDLALGRFMARAPVAVRAAVTPTPAAAGAFRLPPGLPLPLVDPLDVNGSLTLAGSPALAPLTRLLYARFVGAGYRDTMRIDEVSSSVVFQSYCSQDPADPSAVDIVMADRPITQSELENCLERNRKPVALRVALDAVVVVTNVNVDFVTNVNRAELAALATARRWSDVRQGWPNTEIVRVAPTAESMTTTLFVDKILRRNTLLLQNAAATTFLEDGQEIAITVANTPYAAGILNFADYKKNPEGLRLLAVDGVTPNEQTVSSGAYVLTYPLLLYTDMETLTTRTQAGAFLLYYLANMNDLLNEAGYFPVSEAVYERTKVVMLTALGQGSYLEQFAPTNTPTPPPTATSTLTPTVAVTATVTAAVTATMTVTR